MLVGASENLLWKQVDAKLAGKCRWLVITKPLLDRNPTYVTINDSLSHAVARLTTEMTMKVLTSKTLYFYDYLQERIFDDYLQERILGGNYLPVAKNKQLKTSSPVLKIFVS